MANYKNYEEWQDMISDESLNQELKRDSMFISILNCAPLPCCVQFQSVKWANDVKLLAGFIKNVFFRDIWGMMFDLETMEYDDLWDMNEMLLELGAVSDEELNKYTDFCNAIDKVFECESNKDMCALVEAIEVFNKSFDGMNGFTNKIQFIDGFKELKPFLLDYFEHGSEYPADRIDWMFRSNDLGGIRELLEEIV